MFFKITATSGQSLYLQLMQQIRHAIESGALRDGDQLPGIRTLAQELVVSPNTIAKAYSELEHEGLLELRQGSGAFISVNRRTRSLSNHIQAATRSVADLVEQLRERDFRDEEIRRMFEAALLHQPETARKIRQTSWSFIRKDLVSHMEKSKQSKNSIYQSDRTALQH